QLGDGIQRVRVLATDGLGQQLLSRPARLRIDSEPPSVDLTANRPMGVVKVRVADADSGLRRQAPLIRFGDGTQERGHPVVTHAFAHAGAYTVLVRARDKVGNGIVRRFRVRVR